MIKAVLFDLDGTLANSIEDLADSTNKALKALGFPGHTVGEYKYFVGDGIPKLIERALPENRRDKETKDACLELFMEDYRVHYHDKTKAYDGVREMLSELKSGGLKLAVISNKAQEMAEKAVAIFRERYATIGLFENSVFPGVVELLQALRKKGKRLAVATSKKEDLAVRILEHFEIADYFEVIGGDRREVGRDNKAKVIDYVLETMQAKKDDVIMIGDRKFDIEGAHAIGIPCIAVEYGYGDRDEFKAHGADYIAKTTEDVEKLF